MLRSMTGFGKGAAENKRGRVKIEIKSLNYKFFEVINRLPGNLAIFEDSIREHLQKRLSRGRLNLFMSYEKKESGQSDFYIDKHIASQYYNMALSLKRSLRITSGIDINQVISFPGVIAHRPQDEQSKKLWPLIERALARAASDLISSREREGRTLKKELRRIVKALGVSLGRIKRRAPVVKKEYKARLFKSIRSMTGSKRVINREKAEEEIAIFARNCDISEEIQRLSSHIMAFKKLLSNGGEMGRHMDFMAQEMYREINTIGAKANDFPIAKEVIKAKSLIEKIREQAQNVE